MESFYCTWELGIQTKGFDEYLLYILLKLCEVAHIKRFDQRIPNRTLIESSKIG